MSARANAKVTCLTDGDVVVPMDGLVIDTEEGVYRFTCPTCGAVNDKAMDERIWRVLRYAGVPTIDELVQSGVAVLNDDTALQNVLKAWT
jgi:predicted RNA-binding Zn-ribbon protein involved in translation (DUF1610 family)